MALNKNSQSTVRLVLSMLIEGIGIFTQLLLVYVGFRYFFLADTDEIENAHLASWAILATLYLAFTVFWLNIDLRVHVEDHRFITRAAATGVMRMISTIMTFSSSLIGLSAAVELIMTRNSREDLSTYELIAVWAMLVSWALFHWGYARIYYSSYYRHEANPQIEFPSTERPRLIDFVYFSFTNGTSFAPSDVKVMTTRMRWKVVWHTSFSFFFNALIIVLTMNTISGGFHLD